MTISELCNREVVFAEPTLSIADTARLMREHHVGDVIVAERVGHHARPLGIVTDRDIVVEVVAAGLAPESLTAGDVMGPELAVVRENEGVFETLRYMRVKAVRRMPVVDRDGWLLGIVTLDDLMELLAEEMGELARLISRERHREAELRKQSIPA
ncbi:MAG TPA: CBS domain-containing protein [Thiobacillaceae bacterium]|nr:CBS domain-containing protein [Thiobacillaceae bacterium]